MVYIMELTVTSKIFFENPVSLSRASTMRDLPIKSLQESVTIIDHHSGLPPLAYHNIERLQENIPDLREWLSRLSDTFEETSLTNYKAPLYSAIAKTLCLASEDSNELSQFMLETLKDQIFLALTSCNNTRMGMSVIYLDLCRQSLVIDKSDLRAYANFIIKGQWTIELLEEVARQKATTIRGHFDEIEVYLAYLIPLKEKLELPICLNDKNFLHCGGIIDISEAVEHINSITGKEENKIQYLLRHAEFKTAYEQCYPEEVREATDKSCDAADPSKLENVLNNELARHLTSILFPN